MKIVCCLLGRIPASTPSGISRIIRRILVRVSQFATVTFWARSSGHLESDCCRSHLCHFCQIIWFEQPILPSSTSKCGPSTSYFTILGACFLVLMWRFLVCTNPKMERSQKMPLATKFAPRHPPPPHAYFFTFLARLCFTFRLLPSFATFCFDP